MELSILNEVRKATLSARERTSDGSISTRTSKGKMQIGKSSFDKKGVSSFSPISDWVSLEDAVKFLDAIH
jgi:hypothetical protein